MTEAGGRTNPRLIMQRERAMKALRLRKIGYSYSVIAEQCGYASPNTALRSVQRAMRFAIASNPDTDELRQLEGYRLDDLQQSWWNRAKQDPHAARIVLAIMDQRAELFGLKKNQAKIANAMEIAALADLARAAALNAHLLSAMAKVGIDPDQQDALIAELNRGLEMAELEAPVEEDWPDVVIEGEVADVHG